MNRDVGAHPNDEHDQLDRGDWLPDYLHGGSSLYRNWDFRPSPDRGEGCQRIWWRAQFLNLFGATTFQDSLPEIFGFASGSEIVALPGLDLFLDFAADPINGQPNYFAINGTGGANPNLLSGDTGSFLVQPVLLPPALALFATGIALLGLSIRRWTRKKLIGSLLRR